MISCALQIAPLYEKLKHRLYNSFYRRQKRLESRFSGDITKIREELGVDVPHRPKRPRKSKEVSQSTPSAQTTTNESDTTTKVASASSTQHAPIETTSLLSNEGEKHFCTYCFYNFFQGIAPLSVMSRHLRAHLHHYSHQKTMAVRQLHAMHCHYLLVLMPQPRNPLQCRHSCMC